VSASRKVVVAFATMLLMVAYLVFVGIVGVEFAWVLSVQFNLNLFAFIGGMGIFATVVGVELFILMILGKPSPILLIFSSPFVIGLIALDQTVNSKSIRRLIRHLGETMRSSPFPIPSHI
jgi:hypothetical protein